MTEVIRADGKKGELLDLIPRPRLLPGEDPEAYDALRHALLLELAPGTAYETALAETLVQLEWERGRAQEP